MSVLSSILEQYYGYALTLGFIYSFIFIYIFKDYRNENSVKWFIIASTTTGLWLTIEGITSLMSSSSVAYYGLYSVRIIGSVASLSIFFFVVEYTRGIKLNYKHIIAFFSPLIILHSYVILTPHSIFSDVIFFENYIEWTYSEYGQIHYIYLLIIHIISIGSLALETLLSRGVAKKKQSLVLLSGYLCGVVPAFLTGTDLLPAYINLSLIGLCLSLIIFGMGIKRYSLFSANSVNNPTFINKIEEGILTVNEQGFIADFNHSACEILGKNIHIGDRIDEIEQDFPEVKQVLDNKKEESISTNNRVYAIDSYEIPPNKQILVFRDNTNLREEREKLELVRKIHARIFRHNLRNKMTVINGHAEMIQKDLADDHPAADSAEKVEQCSEEIIKLNEKTSEINEVIESLNEEVTYEVESLIKDQVKRIETNYGSSDYEISINLDNKVIKGHPMLPTAIYNILENCVSHNDSPTINIKSNSITNNKLRIIFTDDGEGIQPAEYEPLEDGDITQLKHASSSGLWLIKWITEYASDGGEFMITETATGTTCKIDLSISEKE